MRRRISLRRRSAFLVYGLLMCAWSCGKSAEQQEWKDPTTWDSEVDDVSEARALFEEQVLSPLRDWKFEPANERYAALQSSERDETVTWRLDRYEISDLTWEIRRGRWSQFEAQVTFRSQGRLMELDRDLVHDHKHIYGLSRRAWKLNEQSYSVDGRSCGCLVGHLNCDVWMVEAICVDESNRFRSLED